ncbi:acyl-CoA dehydrogenase family protein [bacterium]|nr:acyl-CoA dehydrogenase family protein [bacterium]
MTRMDTDMLASVLDTLDKYCRDHFPREKRLELDRTDAFPEGLIRAMLSPEVGLHLVFLPEAYDGLGGGAYDIYRISEEMARIDMGMATAFLAISLGTDPLRVGGSEEQKRKWMTRIAREGLMVAYAVTEPNAGSDLAALKTRAEPMLDQSGQVTGYRLEGVKQFITNGGIADLYSVLALAPGGPTFFMVEKGRPGLSGGKAEEKHGIRLSNTAQVIFEGVEVPVEDRVGPVEGQGLAQAVAVFGYTRLMVAAFGLGGGEAALSAAIAYARERCQFGQPIIELPGYSYKLLVPHVVNLEASRAYIEEVADRLDNGETGLEIEGAIAKLFVTESANRAADASIQALGGYGYTHEYEVEKIRRDVRITTIYEGTSEIMQQTIGKDRWRVFLQSRGQFYLDKAAELERLHVQYPKLGAGSLAESFKALVPALEQVRILRLTRQQYVQFILADIFSRLEVGLAFCRRVSRIVAGAHKASDYFQALSRLYVAETGGIVATGLEQCLFGFGAGTVADLTRLQAQFQFTQVKQGYCGYGQDLELVRKRLTDDDFNFGQGLI